MRGSEDLHEDKPYPLQFMSSESVLALVDCLVYKLAFLRNLSAEKPNSIIFNYDSERITLHAFLTALYGSGFNWNIRAKKNDKFALISDVLENLTTGEMITKTEKIYNCIIE